MSRLKEFIAHLELQVKNHSIYVWGAQGQTTPTITEAWIRKMETSTDYANRAIKFWKKQVATGYGAVLRAFDCSGLGMYWLQNTQKIVSGDMSSNTMLNKCDKISRANLERGDWVFRVSNGKAYHIGYIVDDALNVIEAKGRDDGVVKRALNASGSSYWNAYGRPSRYFSELKSETKSPEPSPINNDTTITRVLKRTSPVMKGDDVSWLKQQLVTRGYLKTNTKNTFGDETEIAVIAYQKNAGLEADGKAGKNTIEKLGGIWRG